MTSIILGGAAQGAEARGPTSGRESALAFVKKHCAECHAGTAAKGQLLLNKVAGNPAEDRSEAQLWSRMLERLKAGEMPPHGHPAPAAAEVDALAKWLMLELAHSQVRADPRPSGGNHVPHELLFGKVQTGPTASDARIWRSRLPLYENFFARVIRLDNPRLKPKPLDYKQEIAIPLYDYSPPGGSARTKALKTIRPWTGWMKRSLAS